MTFGFVLDFDGTILDSISIVGKIQLRVLEQFDIKMTPELKANIEEKIDEILQGENRKKIGKPIMVAIFKMLGLNFFQRIKALILAGKAFKELAPKVELIEGAEETFKFFENNHLPYIIATTSSNAEVADRLRDRYPEFFSKIKDKIIARDDVVNLKPHPESIKKAASMMGIPIQNCIVVGDMKADIELGKNVGALTIGVLTGFLNENQFKTLKADFIMKSIADIPNNIDKIKAKVSSNA